MQSRILLAVSAIALSLASSAHAAIVIDDFTTVVPDVNILLPKASSSIGPITVGKAEVTVTQTTAGGVFNGIQVASGTDGTFGVLDYSSGNRDGAVKLDYAGADLTGISTLAGILIGFEYIDPGTPNTPFTISISATFTTGGTLNASAPYSGPGTGNFIFATPSFSAASGLTALSITFDAPKAGDFTISSILGETDTNNLPEPAAATLAAPALALLARRRR